MRAAGIVKWRVQHALRVGTGEAAIKASNTQLLIEQQIVCEFGDVNSQVGLVEQFLVQSGIARHLLGNCCSLLRRDGVAFGESSSIGARGPLLHFGAQLARILGHLRRKFVMKCRDHRVGRHNQNVGQIIAVRRLERAQIHRRGEQDDAAERNSPLHQISSEAGGACGAVTFAQDV